MNQTTSLCLTLVPLFIYLQGVVLEKIENLPCKMLEKFLNFAVGTVNEPSVWSSVVCVSIFQVFQKLSEENKGKVHVFYCGAPALAKVIKAQCEHFGFNFYKENF